MFDEIKKSIQSILYERIASPLSGAFAITWTVWNWKLVYYLVFGDEQLNIKERFNFIDTHFININTNLIYPFASAVVLVVFYPILTTWAYEIMLRYKTWQRDIKNRIEKNVLLTAEQSYKLRLSIKKQEEEFERLFTEKDETIKALSARLKEIDSAYYEEQGNIEETERIIEKRIENQKRWDLEYEQFSKTKIFNNFDGLIDRISRGTDINNLNMDIVTYGTIHKLIKRVKGLMNVYDWTDKGEYFAGLRLNEKIN